MDRGAPVPADVFGDIDEFFAVVVDGCHHGKEEAELFPCLVARGSGAIAQRLEQEHSVGRWVEAAYGRAVGSYVPGLATTSARLATAARTYAGLLRKHIELETRERLPAAEANLAEDDPALTEAFERLEVQRIGAGTHERLHGMIDRLGRTD